MAEFDDRTWKSSQFRIHASDQEQELEKRIADADHKIRAIEVFKDPEANQRLIDEADAAGRADRLPHAMLRRLRTDPRSIGPLRGSLLDDKRETRLSAKELAVRLEARAEMRSTQNKYDKLWREANAAERLSPEEEAQRLEPLRNNRATCDAARDSREIEFRDAIDGLRHEPEFQPEPDDRRAHWFPRR